MSHIYYSQRTGRGPLSNPDVEDLGRALTRAVSEMSRREYLQEWYGFQCVDAGHIDGRAAMSLVDHIEAETGWRHAWPLPDPLLDVEDYIVPQSYFYQELRRAEDKIFDLIEYFHAHVSEGVEDAEHSFFHEFNRCGWHYGGFDAKPAQELFRKRMNRILANYQDGFRLNESGQIEHTADDGIDQLIDAALPTSDPDIAKRVTGAIALYRNRGRTGEDLRLAVRELFDVLEKLRPVVKAEMPRGDEGDLFNIANNFTIRHLNERQKGNYDSSLWHSWMFYINLSTIHLIIRLAARQARQEAGGDNKVMVMK